MTATATERTVFPGMNTPWGGAQHASEILPGMGVVSTASHGGIRLSAERNAQVPDYMRRDSGWYEEDCEWSIPFCVFEAEIGAGCSDDCTQKTLKEGKHRETLRNWYPDEFERLYCVTALPGESFKKDERAFYARHADDWLVRAAYGDCKEGVPKGMVKVVATRGGNPVNDAGLERRFLVPAAEYNLGLGNRDDPTFGFVIDLARHQEVRD
jgi:hypothetical protein